MAWTDRLLRIPIRGEQEALFGFALAWSWMRYNESELAGISSVFLEIPHR